MGENGQFAVFPLPTLPLSPPQTVPANEPPNPALCMALEGVGRKGVEAKKTGFSGMFSPQKIPPTQKPGPEPNQGRGEEDGGHGEGEGVSSSSEKRSYTRPIPLLLNREKWCEKKTKNAALRRTNGARLHRGGSALGDRAARRQRTQGVRGKQRRGGPRW